jgi:hypothetical protein
VCQCIAHTVRQSNNQLPSPKVNSQQPTSTIQVWYDTHGPTYDEARKQFELTSAHEEEQSIEAATTTAGRSGTPGAGDYKARCSRAELYCFSRWRLAIVSLTSSWVGGPHPVVLTRWSVVGGRWSVVGASASSLCVCRAEVKPGDK